MEKNNALGIVAGAGTNILVYATSPKLLAQVVTNFIKALPKKKNSIALALTGACGCERNYKTVKDIPKRSVKCKHKNYFIKYANIK